MEEFDWILDETDDEGYRVVVQAVPLHECRSAEIVAVYIDRFYPVNYLMDSDGILYYVGKSRTTLSSLKITVLAVPRSMANSCLKNAIDSSYLFMYQFSSNSKRFFSLGRTIITSKTSVLPISAMSMIWLRMI